MGWSIHRLPAKNALGSGPGVIGIGVHDEFGWPQYSTPSEYSVLFVDDHEVIIGPP